MNFNEEMEYELQGLSNHGKVVPIKEEDKGTPEDYVKLDMELMKMDIKNTTMLRESVRNARFGLPCGESYPTIDSFYKTNEQLSNKQLTLKEPIESKRSNGIPSAEDYKILIIPLIDFLNDQQEKHREKVKKI